MADKFGMMSEAYFKGKRELIQWASDFLRINIPKVETFSTGAYYCQLLDALFPETMKMSKVNFGARTEPEFLKNWKLVQAIFEKQSIQKVIPIERLIKARFQDNLEFLQWFYQYFQSTFSGEPYDPEARRRRSKGTSSCAGYTGSGPAVSTTSKRKTSAAPVISRGGSKRIRPASGASKPSGNGAKLTEENKTLRSQVETLSTSQTKLRKKFCELDKEHQELQKVAKEIEKERDFYFKIVVQVENLCKNCPEANQDYVQQILKVLYSQDDDSPRNQLSDHSEPGSTCDVDMA